MNLKRFCTRFREMRTCYVGTKVSFLDKIFYAVDYVFAFIINELYKEFLGRDWIDVNNVDEMLFISFCHKYPVIFIKEINGYRGIGTRKIETENLNAKDLYNELISDINSHYIAEEQITQISELENFHPCSINTIRIVTVYDTINDKVHIMNARLRMGNKKNNVDNFHFSGIGANINIETGIIDTIGYDAHNNTYIVHPITGKQMIMLIMIFSNCTIVVYGNNINL